MLGLIVVHGGNGDAGKPVSNIAGNWGAGDGSNAVVEDVESLGCGC